jgi:hypothetical protein
MKTRASIFIVSAATVIASSECAQEECRCFPENPVQLGGRWDRFSAGWSGTVVASEATELIGETFFAGTGSFEIYTQLDSGPSLLRVNLVHGGYYVPGLYDFDELYFPEQDNTMYLDDSGVEQVFVSSEGDRLFLWMTEVDYHGEVTNLDGRLESNSGTEIVDMFVQRLSYEESECYRCYEGDGDH